MKRARWVEWGQRRRWPLLVSAVLVLLVFLQEPGHIVSDTKLDLAVDPWAFLSRARDLWDPSASFGRIQNQAVGYWFPMGPFFTLGDLVGLPPWMIQRLWMSLIVVVALWGFLRLAEALDVGTPAARLAAGTAFAAGPAVLIELASRSPNVVPLALLPFVLRPLVLGARSGSPRRAASRSALAVGLMGGINAAATASALAVPLLFLLTREKGPRRRVLVGWWVPAVAAATAWWWGPLLLQARYGFDFTPYTEPAAATGGFMSLTEILRGTGFWLARLRTGGEPWLPAGIQLATHWAAVLGTVGVAAGGLVGLSHRRMPERKFLLISLAFGIATMGMAYDGGLGAPLAEPVRDLLDGPLVAFRNVHKLAPLVALPLALGAAHALGLLTAWWGDRSIGARAKPAIGLAGAVAVLGILAASGMPLATERLAQANSFAEVPSYWEDAVEWLDEHGDRERSLVVPGAPFGQYEWGDPLDEPIQALGEGRWVVRDIVPYGGLRSTRLMDSIETLFETGTPSAGLAELLSRSGVAWVVARNDLDWELTESPAPRFVRSVLDGAPGLERIAEFGPVVGHDLARERLLPDLGGPDPPLRAVEIYRVEPAAASVDTYDLDDTLAVSGGPESILTLSESGQLEDRGVVLAGDLDQGVGGDRQWVVTDDLRRRDVDFGLVHSAESYTLRPAERSPDTERAPVDRLLPADEESLTTVDYLGVAGVRASSYYTGHARQPGMQPAAAVDGDPTTAWHMAGFRSPVDEWIEIQLEEPRELDTVRLRLPVVPDGGGFIRTVRITTDGGAAMGRFDQADQVLDVPLPDGATDHVRVTVVSARRTPLDLLPVGIAEIDLGDVDIQRVVVAPAGPPAAQASDGPTTVVLSRDRADPFEATAADEDRQLVRRVRLGGDAAYQVSGVAVPVPGAPLTRRVVTALGERAVAATSTWREIPSFRPGAALDGDPGTAWIADVTDPSPALTLRWNDPRRIEGARVVAAGTPVIRPTEIVVTGAGETRRAAVGEDGVARFDPITTDALTIALPTPAGRQLFGLVGLAEVDVLPGAPAADTPSVEDQVVGSCGSGPPVRVGERVIETRVEGTTGDLVNLRPLRFEGCGDLEVPAGDHLVRGADAGGLRIETLVLASGPAFEGAGSRTTEIRDWGREHREVEVGEGDAALLALTENANDGWVARLDGRRLDRVTVDGWRQGWVVPAGAEGVVDIEFEPGRLYDRMLVVGLFLALLVIALALAPGASDPPPVGERAISDLWLLGGATVALGLAAGPVAILVPLVWLAVPRPGLRSILAGGALVAIGLLVANHPGLGTPSFEVEGQLLAGLALAAAFVGPIVRRRRRPDQRMAAR